MRARVLLVDDQAIFRTGLRSVLETEGLFSVVGEAADGREAVRMAQRLKPEVVVMDLAMRDLNGIEATRQIVTARLAIGVVVLSSYDDRRYVQAALAAGASGYVLKSDPYDELRRAIVAALAGRKYLCPSVTSHVVESAIADRVDSVYQILAPREIEVLQLIAEGATSAEVGSRLGIATSTVDTHRRNIMRKLNVHTIAELTKFAIREGLTPLERGPEPGSGD